MATTAAPTPARPEDKQWFAIASDAVARELGTDERTGLAPAEAATRLQKYGANAFVAAATEPRWRAFVRQYRDPMQIVLLVAGIGSIWPLHELGTGLVLLFLTLFNAVLGLNQEGKAAAAVAALQKMMIVKAKVRRGDELVEVPAEQLVPGDIVAIEAGDVVPADGRLLKAATLEVDESALTGESMPVAKSAETVTQTDAPLGDRTDMAYMNTNVTRGAGELIVTTTGMSTEVGHISNMLSQESEAASPLTKQLNKLTSQILVISGTALVISIVINASRPGNTFKEVFLAAIAFAIAAIPTGLPAVVTAILSMGTQTLAKANAIMKRLRSTETLGSTSAINSDKTGTLTLNQMTAVELTIPGRRYSIDGTGYSTQGVIKKVAGQPEVDLEPFMQPLVLACDAVVHDGTLIGDPTEGALVVLGEKGGLAAVATRETYPRVAELPFDTAYKLMATFHRMKDESGADVVRCFVKGAPDQVLARSTHTLAPDDLHLIDADAGFKERYEAENERLGEQGLRVLATGRKDFDPDSFEPNADLLPLLDGLTALALVGIVDPPRPAAKDAIAIAHSAGIQVRMITGDHAVTAAAIAQNLGITGRAITGAEFAAMSDDELLGQIDDIGVIARVTPEDKVRLVDTLKRKGQIVAMTGDGVNDAPALKRADIGIAMGITGTEVSKEAAAMILTDDNFATIVRAVELGRGLYDNLTKYIRFQMGVLFGLVFTFLGAAIGNIVGGVAFVPLQTLWLNFTTQVFQAVGLGYGEPAEGLMARKPRDPEAQILPRSRLLWLALVGAVMGAATLGVLAWADSHYDREVARTMGMTSFSIANLLYSFCERDERESVFSLDVLRDRRFLMFSGASVLAIILAPQLNLLNRILLTTPLTVHQWLICIVAALATVVLTEGRKLMLRRREANTAETAPEPA
ncbi:MAG: cation-transporting P-type ATPase [Gaiellaceae bacterium]